MGSSRQRGAVLAISLIMLGLLTLVGVTAITAGMVNFKLVANLQAQREVEMALQRGGQIYISSDIPFSGVGTCNPAAETYVVNGLAVTVDVDEPICLNVSEPEGESLTSGAATPVTVWEIQASARDPISGAQAIGHWGLSMPLLTACPVTRSNTGC